MEATLKSKVSEIFARYHFSSEDARFISDVLNEIDERQEEKFLASKELFLTQPDKVELIDRISDAKTELTNKINDVKMELTDKISEVETKLINKINDVEARLTDKMTDKINQLDVRLTNRVNAVQRSVYIVGLVQFLAIVASVIAIISFMLK